MDHRISKDMISSGIIPSGEKNQEDLRRTQYGTAPSPNALSDVYKKMYETKEEVINEMKMGDVSGSADFASRNIKGAKGAATPKEPPKATMTDKPSNPVDAKRERLKKIMADNESVNLLAAYRSVYEHHKKDADGNTIPHEGEELNEGKIPAGLQAYLDKKKGKKEDKKDMKEQYDLVYEHFIGEGFSEEETYERMSNLTEEQLDEFMKALATSAAKYGASLGGNTPAPKMGPARPNAKPGQTGFKASSPSQVVADVNARKKEASAFKAKPLRDKMDSALTKLRAGNLKFGSTSKNEDQKEEYVKEGIGMAAKAALGLVKKIASKQAVKKLAGNVATGAAMSAGSNLMSGGGGGGQQKQKTGTVSASADLFDIVKGQLLDEGLSEEEIQDIMLTLTPDEILNEISVGKMANYISAADKDVQKTADSMRKDGSVMGDDPRIKKMTNRAKGMALAGSKIAKNPVK